MDHYNGFDADRHWQWPNVPEFQLSDPRELRPRELTVGHGHPDSRLECGIDADARAVWLLVSAILHEPLPVLSPGLLCADGRSVSETSDEPLTATL